MKKIIVITMLVFFASCKTKAVLAEGRASKTRVSEDIIAGHYANKKDFTTLYIKATARYKDAEQTQNVTADIKIKKDQQILVSLRFLGITMAKAIITPKEVRYYEKINGKYFEGDYTTLSRWLGTDLDFAKVQNLFVGQAMDNLTAGKYTNSIEDKLYKLEDNTGTVKKAFYFEGERFLIRKQELAQPAKNRTLKVNYPSHKQYAQGTLPVAIFIQAFQDKGKTDINIEYNAVTFDEELSFPYSVPEGYERIFID